MRWERIVSLSLTIVLLLGLLPAGAGPAMADVTAPTAATTVTGTAFADANRSGTREPGEAGLGGLTIFHDADGDGTPGAAEAATQTGPDGSHQLPLSAGAAGRICLLPPTDQAPTTLTCRPVGGQPIAFGLAPLVAGCRGGTVLATITGIALASAPTAFVAPTLLSGPAQGIYAGSRLWLQPPGQQPLTYVQAGELVQTTLTLGGALTGRAGLALNVRYQRAFQAIERVVATDGSGARWLGTGNQPPAMPADFSVFDKNGELLIYNLPLDGAGRPRDLTLETRVTATRGHLTLSAGIAGVAANGRLNRLANSCGDSAGSTIFAGPGGPLGTVTATLPPTPSPTATPVLSVTIIPSRTATATTGPTHTATAPGTATSVPTATVPTTPVTTPTATPSPPLTLTATVAPSLTPIPATATSSVTATTFATTTPPAPTLTATIAPTSTAMPATATITPTSASVPATATATISPTTTPSATPTALPPTPTVASTASATSTPTLTATVPPSATPTATGTAAPSQSSIALLRAAVQRGEISDESGVIYTVYALFDDPRLPAQYRGNDAKVQATSTLSAVKERLPSLSAGTQALLAPFFIPPIYAESWEAVRNSPPATLGMAGRAEARLTAADVAPPLCSTVTGNWRSLDSAKYPVRFWYKIDPATANSDRGLARNLLDEMDDHIWPRLTGTMLKDPLSDLSKVCNGLDGRLDIYLSPGLPRAFYDYYDACEAAGPGYVVMNPTNSKETLAHEFMHVLQYTFMRASCEEYRWWDETTAMWAVDHVYPTSNWEHNASIDFFTSVGRPLEFVRDGPEYGAYVFPFFMSRIAQDRRPDLVRDSWRLAGSASDSLVLLDSLVGGFKDAWPKFARANLNIREPHPVADDYFRVDGLPWYAILAPNLDIELGPGKGIQVTRTFLTDPLDHLSARYARFSFAGEDTRTVLFTNGLAAADEPDPDAKVQALYRLEGETTWTEQDWTKHEERFFCRDRRSERIEELIIIVSYSQFRDRSKQLDMGDGLTISATTAGCWRYQGDVQVTAGYQSGGGLCALAEGYKNCRAGATLRGTIIFEIDPDTETTTNYYSLPFHIAGGGVEYRHSVTYQVETAHTTWTCTSTVSFSQPYILGHLTIWGLDGSSTLSYSFLAHIDSQYAPYECINSEGESFLNEANRAFGLGGVKSSSGGHKPGVGDNGVLEDSFTEGSITDLYFGEEHHTWILRPQREP